MLDGACADRATAAATSSCPISPSATSKALTNRPKFKRKLKVVAACGNGTAGAFAPKVLEALGCEVVPLDCRPRLHLPALQSQPRRHEDAARDAAKPCVKHKADVGLGFDGDGDRCGVVDNEGHEIFADKVGVMLARDLSAVLQERECSSST